MDEGFSERRRAHLARLARIQGQVRGIGRMLEQDRPCAEVLPQVRSAINALCRVQDHLLREHLEVCVRECFAGRMSEEAERRVEEIFELLSRYRGA